MDTDLIKTIAEEVIKESILSNYLFYLLVIGLSLISASVSAFFVSYFRKRGETLAIQSDLHTLKRQISETTRISESIKTDISSKSRDEADIKTLLRQRLELIFSTTFEVELWLEKTRTEALDGKLPDTNGSPFARVEMYHAIYFCEIKEEFNNLESSYVSMVRFILEIASQKIQGQQPNIEYFSQLQTLLSSSIKQFRTALLEKYAHKVGL